MLRPNYGTILEEREIKIADKSVIDEQEVSEEGGILIRSLQRYKKF